VDITGLSCRGLEQYAHPTLGWAPVGRAARALVIIFPRPRWLLFAAAGRRLTPRLDIGTITAYSYVIAPDSDGLSREMWEAVRDRSFLFRRAPVRRGGQEKGKSPRELTSPTAIFRAGPATSYVKFLLTQESVMSIVAWIVLGLVAGLLANLLVPGRRSQGLILTCVIGIAGALAGGWAATELFHVHTLHGFFNLSTWLTAIVGAAILLLLLHLFTARQSTGRGRRTRRRTSYARR
jgi:uncharacterized membrane protein YeaQ/YmgE (transglycosylase-associated protein family)